MSVGLVTEADSLPSGGQSALEDFYRRNVAACPEVGELLEGADLVQHPLAASKLLTIRDWSYRCDPVCGDGWFLVGDAAMFVNPILSTGLLITSNGASMAANALLTLWNDPDVETARLLASYDATYREAGMSFHRLAHIWYARNFKRTTWHWEAKRQRLRTGRGIHGARRAPSRSFTCVSAPSQTPSKAHSLPQSWARTSTVRTRTSWPRTSLRPPSAPVSPAACPMPESLTRSRRRSRARQSSAPRMRAGTSCSHRG